MRTEQLIYFVETVKWRSINLASEKLHITQQTLSVAIKTLEKELDVQLLERTYQGISLTENGKIFHKTAKEILALLERTKSSFITAPPAASGLSGELTLYASPALYMTILPDIISTFTQQYPAVHLTLVEEAALSIVRRFEQAGQGPALGLINLLPQTDELPSRAIPLIRDQFIICVSPKSPLAKHKQLSIKTILKHPLILYMDTPKEDHILYKMLCAFSEPDISLSTGNLHLYFQSIISDLGIGFLPNLVLHNPSLQFYLDDIVTIPIKEDFSTQIYCLAAQNQEDDPLVTQMIQLLRAIQPLNEALQQTDQHPVRHCQTKNVEEI